HACAVLARLATRPILVFLDADVRLAPDGLGRMIVVLDASGADLISGVPRQITVGLTEQLVIPLIHFILLGFLPIRRMRKNRSPSLAAGCGQLFVTKASSYEQAGGHASIRSTFHDGLKLPRVYRTAGLRTDLFDATEVASCRMYQNASDLWTGLSKNATEALAAPSMIVPATILLLGGQVMPSLLLLFALALSRVQLAILIAAFVATYLPRLAGVRRFRQSSLGAFLHPIGITVLLAIQWTALVRKAVGRPVSWKGRARPALGDRSAA
ncbi:glycosyltransferase, partial [Singulisphaera rosea]